MGDGIEERTTLLQSFSVTSFTGIVKGIELVKTLVEDINV